MEEILEVADGYDPDRNEFTFHRQPRNFNSVLNFMRTGKLHLGEETCVIAFSQVRPKGTSINDVRFFGVIFDPPPNPIMSDFGESFYFPFLELDIIYERSLICVVMFL